MTGSIREKKVVPVADDRGQAKRQSMDYAIRSAIAGGTAGCAAKTLVAPLDRVKILFQTGNPAFRVFTKSWLGFYKAGREIYKADGVLALFQGHSATLLNKFPYAAVKFVAYEQVRALLIPTKQHESPIRRFAAGSLSGIASVLFTYPLDLVRVRLAYDTTSHSGMRGRLVGVIKKVYNEDHGGGIRNFYHGFGATISGMIPYAGVSFLVYDLCHDLFRTKLFAPYTVQERKKATSRQQLTAWAQLVAGGISGLCAQTASYPFEVVRRRMQVSGETGNKISMLQTFKSVYTTRGLRGFFVGLTIGYMKVVPMFACSFYVYERMKLLLSI